MSSPSGGDENDQPPRVDPAWSVAKYSIRPSLDSTGGPFYGAETSWEYLSTKNMLRKVIACGSHEACNRLGVALSSGGSTIQHGSNYILRYLGHVNETDGIRDEDFLQSTGLLDIVRVLQEPDGLQWREAMEFFNEASDAERTDEMVHEHARRWLRFVQDRSETLLPAFRRLAIASSKLYIYSMEAVVQLTLAGDIANWQNHMRPTGRWQVPAVHRWLSAEPADSNALVDALAESYLEQVLRGPVEPPSDGQEPCRQASRGRRTQPQSLPHRFGPRGRRSRTSRRRAASSSDTASARRGRRGRQTPARTARLSRSRSQRRRRSASGMRRSARTGARHGGCCSGSPAIARPLWRASALSAPRCSAADHGAESPPGSLQPDVWNVWPIEDLHAFADQYSTMCSACGVEAPSPTELQALLAAIPVSIRKAHGLPVSHDDFPCAQKAFDHFAAGIAKCVWTTKMAYVKLTLKCFEPFAKFRPEVSLMSGGLLRLLSKHTTFLDNLDDVCTLFKKVDEATDDRSRDAARAEVCKYEHFVLQTEVLDAGSASAYWEKSVAFVLQHTRREPSLVEMRAYMELVEDGVLREALGLTPLKEFKAKVKPANWCRDAARLFTTVYLCYKSHMTHKVQAGTSLTDALPDASVEAEAESKPER